MSPAVAYGKGNQSEPVRAQLGVIHRATAANVVNAPVNDRKFSDAGRRNEISWT